MKDWSTHCDNSLLRACWSNKSRLFIFLQIRLTANPKTTPKSGGGKVAAWIIIVSILGGLLLFCLVGFALYKVSWISRCLLSPKFLSQWATSLDMIFQKL